MTDTINLLRYHLSNPFIDKNKEGEAIAKIMSGCIIAEYGLRQLVDDAKQELKRRVQAAIKANLSVQEWLLGHPNASAKDIAAFRNEYLSDKNVLLSELFNTVYGLGEADLEMIIESIKAHIDTKKEESHAG